MVVLLLLLLQLPALVHAHEIRPSVADITFNERELIVELRTNLEALVARIGPEHEDSDNSPNAQQYTALRELPPEELESRLVDFLPAFLDSMDLRTNNNQTLDLSLLKANIPDVGDTSIARDSILALKAIVPADTTSMSWQWLNVNGPVIVRAGADNAEEAFTQYLDAGTRSDAISIAGNTPRDLYKTVLDYLHAGFIHIVPKGLDHILFVIGLFLLAPRLKPVFWQVSSFTLAHTITLAMGTLGLITLSPAIVEPLIALSIVIIAIENIATDRLRAWRPVMVFAFGLLHGLGFASVLGDVGLQPATFISALVAFNLGVEFGQLTVILGCFVLAGWPFRNKPWYRQRITLPGSIAIALAGIIWFVQRVSS